MKKLIDKDGSVIRGCYKNNNGAIIFDDDNSYNNYLKRKELFVDKAKEVNSLKKEIEILKNLMLQMNKEKDA